MSFTRSFCRLVMARVAARGLRGGIMAEVQRVKSEVGSSRPPASSMTASSPLSVAPRRPTRHSRTRASVASAEARMA